MLILSNHLVVDRGHLGVGLLLSSHLVAVLERRVVAPPPPVGRHQISRMHRLPHHLLDLPADHRVWGHLLHHLLLQGLHALKQVLLRSIPLALQVDILQGRCGHLLSAALHRVSQHRSLVAQVAGHL